MNRNTLFLLPLVLLAGLFSGCGGRAPQTTITVVEKQADLSSSLDLKAVGELAKKAKDAGDLEQLLNSPNGINNLDLDHNGKVNYINVAEIHDGVHKGFDLTTKLADGTEVQLASIEISQVDAQTASMAVNGNPTYYTNHYYQSSFPLGEALLLAWLFAPHPIYYHSPYYYGYYPSYYRVYAPVATTVYTTRTTTYSRGSSFQASAPPPTARTLTKPSVVDPAASQKSFQARSATKPVGSGGFGGSGSLGPSPSPGPKVRSPRSGGSFGRKR